MAKTSKLNLYGLQNRTLLLVLTYSYLFILNRCVSGFLHLFALDSNSKLRCNCKEQDLTLQFNGSMGVLGVRMGCKYFERALIASQ